MARLDRHLIRKELPAGMGMNLVGESRYDKLAYRAKSSNLEEIVPPGMVTELPA